MNTGLTTGKPVNEPNHVAVDLYTREQRMVNGAMHSTIRKNEIRVVDRAGKTVCVMEGRDQDALDTAWVIAKALDGIPEPTAEYNSLRGFLEQARNQTPLAE